ncbi:NYN domain-containing protein [Candidatus Dependentiae bacterium]|nr:NYN domain-containing protein [Candidatus Dependentiae bacterium]
MNIVIDGYNMIKQVLKKVMISEKEREQFLTRLDSYARRKNHTLHVIFDGGPYDRPTREKRKGLTVVYSGRKSSADDVIKSYIEEKLLSVMLIVTTDRHLNAFARNHGLDSIDSIDFYAFMNDVSMPVLGFKKAPGKAHKLNELEESTELDTLMQEGSSVLFYKDEENEEAYDASKKKSRHEKKIQKIVKKL